MRSLSFMGAVLAVGFALALPARANDGALSKGGTPRLISGHSSVSMQSEVIRMTIGEETITTDCRFVFKNDGPACTVRMGFPDQGIGDVPGADHEEPEGSKTPARGTFRSFRSYINGKPVPTKVIRSGEPGGYWHVKEVRFPAKSTVTVRDVYTQIVGAQITGANSVLSQAVYILRTGASWKGNIGSTEVLVTFRRPRPTLPLEPMALKRGSEEDTLFRTDWTKASNRIYWRGFAIPTASGNTLRFVRKNWRPTDRSDLYLAFDNRGPGLGR